MSTQDNTSLVAIFIALIALVAATGQLLQQLFGTAVGYRNCQSSVIGKWSALARRRWRWSEFRFETKFTTPHIFLYSADNSKIGRPRVIFGRPCNIIDSDSVAGLSQYVRRSDQDVEGEESDLVGWLRLLHQLDRRKAEGTVNFLGQDVSKTGSVLSLAAIAQRTRSWDLVPLDIIRPFASSNVGDIIVIAHRLRMVWTDLRPADGIMRAEGNGQAIVSSTIRGFGLLLQFTYDEISNTDLLQQPLLPTREADKMGFRIIPGCRSLGYSEEKPDEPQGLPDFSLDTENWESSVMKAMETLQMPKPFIFACDEYRYREDAGQFAGFCDLVPMNVPLPPFPMKKCMQVIAPHAQAHDTPLRTQAGFRAYRVRLEQTVRIRSSSTQLKWLLECCYRMEGTYADNWLSTANDHQERLQKLIYSPYRDSVDDCDSIWRETTTYFANAERKYHDPSKRFRYVDLVAAHIIQAVQRPARNHNMEVQEEIRTTNPTSGSDEQLDEAMTTYLDSIDEIMAYMRFKGFIGDDKTGLSDTETIQKNKQEVIELYYTLLLRAMCWHRCISFVEGQKPGDCHAVPSKFYGSKIPVYLV